MKLEKRVFAAPQAARREQREGHSVDRPGEASGARPGPSRPCLSLLVLALAVVALSLALSHYGTPTLAPHQRVPRTGSICSQPSSEGVHAAGPPAVISHRGALSGFMPGSRAGISGLQQRGVCRFDLDVSLVEGEYVIGHPHDLLQRFLNSSSPSPFHAQALLRNLSLEQVLSGSGDVVTLEAALALVLKADSGPCRASRWARAMEIPAVLLEPKGEAAREHFVATLTHILLDKLGGGHPAGAVGIWLDDPTLASFTLSALARHQSLTGVVLLLYPVKQYEPLQAAQVRSEHVWWGAGPPCRCCTFPPSLPPSLPPYLPPSLPNPFPTPVRLRQLPNLSPSRVPWRHTLDTRSCCSSSSRYPVHLCQDSDRQLHFRCGDTRAEGLVLGASRFSARGLRGVSVGGERSH